MNPPRFQAAIRAAARDLATVPGVRSVVLFGSRVLRVRRVFAFAEFCDFTGLRLLCSFSDSSVLRAITSCPRWYALWSASSRASRSSVCPVP